MEGSGRTLVCSVLFLDIAGYSQRGVSEQIRLKQSFTSVLAANWIELRRIEDGDDLRIRGSNRRRPFPCRRGRSSGDVPMDRPRWANFSRSMSVCSLA